MVRQNFKLMEDLQNEYITGQIVRCMKNYWWERRVSIYLKSHPNNSWSYLVAILTISKQIQQWYKLSRSTIRRVKYKHRRRIGEFFEDIKSKSFHCGLSEEARNFIRKFIQPSYESLTIWAIKKQIELKLGEVYSNHKIKQFVTKEIR